jgi:broad specificity phosphatase PhoE
VSATRLHLVRHGEVHNPTGVLYGRLPGFSLSERGRAMAAAAARSLVEDGRPISRVLSSPLERAVESAEPIAEAFGLEIETTEQVIEASSRLEGGRYQMNLGILAKPLAWRYLVNPMRPSWGEPFVEVAARVLGEMDAVWDETPGGEVAIVSHQLPIWMAHRAVTGRPLFHDPRRRRCTLSSITSFEKVDGSWREVGYSEPASVLTVGGNDVGAV